MTTQERALDTFSIGLNCAQSVVTTYAPILDFDITLAADMACAFGGGMGRLQKTCGAVTGAFMVLSIWNARKYKDAGAKVQKEKTYEMVQAFNRRFTERHGTTQCHALLGCDMNTEQGRLFMKKNELTASVCQKCIISAVHIVDEMTK